MTESTALTVGAPRPAASSQAVSVWQSAASFESAQRMANALVNSAMVPEAYRGPDNMGSALIALDIAQRINASPLMVMQNLHIISGRPSWGASFIIAALNACGKFSPLRFRVEDLGEQSVPFTEWTGSKRENNLQRVNKTLKVRNKTCVAYCVEKGTGEVLEGPEVSVAMAVAEGWFTKRDSKWPTMTDLMLRYRAAAFFGRLYAPDLLMGMQTEDESRDIGDVEYAVVKTVEPEPEPAPAAATKPGRARNVAAAMKAAEPTKAEPAKVTSGKAESVEPAGAKPKTVAEVAESPLNDLADKMAAGDYSDGYGQDDGQGYDEQDGDVV